MELSEYTTDDFFQEFQMRGLYLEYWKIPSEESRQTRRQHLEDMEWLRLCMPKYINTAPKWRCRAVAERLSREKPLSIEKYNSIIALAAHKFSGNSTNTYNSVSISPSMARDCGYVAFYVGKWLRCPDRHEHNIAEEECDKEGRPFTKLSEWRARKQRAAYVRAKRDEKVVKQNRKLLNQLKEELKNGEQHKDSRAIA